MQKQADVKGKNAKGVIFNIAEVSKLIFETEGCLVEFCAVF